MKTLTLLAAVVLCGASMAFAQGTKPVKPATAMKAQTTTKHKTTAHATHNTVRHTATHNTVRHTATHKAVRHSATHNTVRHRKAHATKHHASMHKVSTHHMAKPVAHKAAPKKSK